MTKFRYRGSCRKASCACHKPGVVCEEFMGNERCTYCDRCGWERGAHLMPELEAALRELLHSTRIEAEQARAAFADPWSGHDAMVRFHETRGVHMGVGMAFEQLIRSARQDIPSVQKEGS